MTTVPMPAQTQRKPRSPLSIEAAPIGAHTAAVWPIDPDITLLNHGSYGVCPLFVRQAQSELRARIDRDPVRFFMVDLERLSDRAREATAAFVGCQPADLTFVMNGTVAIATILRAYEDTLEPGDEIVVTNHEYAATLNELRRLCARTGAVLRMADIPLPCAHIDVAGDAIASELSDKTRLLLVSHITSASSLILPVQRIVDECNHRGIDTIVDGAHAPGQIPLDIDSLGCTFYAASCHKWLCTPKGSAFVYAKPERQAAVQPVALSCRVHRNRPDRKHFLADFDYMGTGDYTANLVLPEAIEHIGSQLPGGWDELYRRNHAMVLEGARVIRERCSLPQTAPAKEDLLDPENMTGSMYSLLLPADPQPGRAELYEDPIWDRLMGEHKIQVPVWDFALANARVSRVSAHLHNRPAQYAAMAEALAGALETESRLG